MLELADVLRRTRSAAGLSQLALALRLNVSQRHVAFLETGRSGPSRALLLSWMREVGASPSTLNAALAHAGMAPIPIAPGGATSEASPMRQAMSRMVAAHDPWPGLVFDADWMTVEMNRGGRWLCSIVMPDLWVSAHESGRRLDMILTVSRSGGLLSRMRNAGEVGSALLGQMRAEALVRPSLRARVERVAQELERRFGGTVGSARDPANPHIEPRFDTPHGVLSFFTIQNVFGLPHDVTPTSLRAELWFPADQVTRDVMLRAQRSWTEDEDHDPECAVEHDAGPNRPTDYLPCNRHAR